MQLSRRECLKLMGRFGAGMALYPLLSRILFEESAYGAEAGKVMGAMYWDAQGGKKVQCNLCPRREILDEGACGICLSRQNQNGKLVTLAYDRPCVLNVDPIEQNPLAHVLPGENVLAVAHAGCNLQCQYCQNWQYSQKKPTETKNVEGFVRAEAIGRAQKAKIRGVSFTYTEPAADPEFVKEMAMLAKSKGLLCAMCTCGFILEKPFKAMLEPFKAVTITYKGATEAFYSEVCGGNLKPVLEAMRIAREEKKWLEIATLVIPGMNDSTADLRTQAEWISKNLGPDTPWHLERFMPMYKLAKLSPTPQPTLERARQIGFDAGLRYVYISNLAPHEGNHTYCPKCHAMLIERLGFKILRNEMKSGRCPHCQQRLPGIWS